MNTLAEKLVDAWKKKDLIKINSEELPKSREESHNIQKQFHDVLKEKNSWLENWSCFKEFTRRSQSQRSDDR